MKNIMLTRKILVFGLFGLACLMLMTNPTQSLAGGGGQSGEDICGTNPDGSQISDPNGDADDDKLTNWQECMGLDESNSGEYITYTGFLYKSAADDRNSYLDPSSMDVFVILLRATACPASTPTCTTCGPCDPFFGASNYPTPPYDYSGDPPKYDPFLLVHTKIKDGGLEIATHETVDLPGRNVTDQQKAIRISESLIPCGNIFGTANQGMLLDEGSVATELIKNFACSNYIDYEIPLPDNSVLEQNMIAFIQYITAHEIGHILDLAPVYNSDFGGNHLAPEIGKVMEQRTKVVINDKKKSVTYDIPQEFAGQCQDSATLFW